MTRIVESISTIQAYVAACRAGVLETGRHLEPIGAELRAVRPMAAAFDPAYVKKLSGLDVPEERWPDLLARVKELGTRKRGLVSDDELRELANG